MEQDFMKYEICKPRDPRFIQMLIDEYNTTNISLHDLSIKYHTDAGYQFKIHNISKRSKGLQRSITRKGCFDLRWNGEKIETEEQAYIIGILMADGFINDAQVGFRLKGSDRYLVEKIKDYFSPEIKLQKDGTAYGFVISSMVLCQNFMKLGFIKHRTGKELHIPNMDKSLFKHFIRGYFDGDGSIFKCNNNGVIHLKSNICCVTTGLLQEIQSVFSENNIHSTINKENRKGKTVLLPRNQTTLCTMDMYRLYVRSKSDIEKLYHFMYDDCHICIERKRKVFEDNMNLLIYQKPRKVQVNTELTEQIA